MHVLFSTSASARHPRLRRRAAAPGLAAQTDGNDVVKPGTRNQTCLTAGTGLSAMPVPGCGAPVTARSGFLQLMDKTTSWPA